jgi:hypothetical protein
VLLGDFFSQFMLMLIVTAAVFMHLCKKVANSKGEVASALKGAATKKAIGLIGWLFK